MSNHLFKKQDGSNVIVQGVVLIDPATGNPVGTGGVAEAVSVADGSNVAQGAKADAPATDGTSPWSIAAILKGIWIFLQALASNPSVVTGNITAATAAPSTVAGLTVASFLQIAGGTVDAVTARVSTITGGAATATLGFYGSDDGVNLFPMSGLPIGGAVGTGALVQTTAAVGAWGLKGAAARAVYLIATAVGAGATVAASLSATPNQSRITSILRGSLGGALSGAMGSPAAEAVTVQGGTLTNSTTTAYAASKVIKASAGNLKKLNGYNSKLSPQFIQIHDAAALPADTAVPGPILYVGAQSDFTFDYGVEGRSFANGIVVCNSSTGPTKTIGSADCWFDAQYN